MGAKTIEQILQMLTLKTRHGRACPGHPRLELKESKAWMPATSAGMTVQRQAGA
jgi:hypothetical protein